MRTEEDYHFLFFGLTSFRSLPQREQALAEELARLGHDVDFIEIPPSMAGRSHALFNRLFSPLSRDSGFRMGATYPNLRVHTPPTLPTGFRNSLTPGLDRAVFRRWFSATFRDRRLEHSIVMVMMPLWWEHFIDREFLRPRLLVYDICDSLEVQARNDGTLRRLRASEHLLARSADLITYSAREMEGDLRKDYPQAQVLFVPNAVSRAFISRLDIEPVFHRNGHPRTVGYIGSTSGKWFDTELVLAVAAAIPDCTLSLVGPVDKRFAERCRAYPNIELHGFVPHDALTSHLRRFDVAIIPFLDNEITRIVNPLKLYEYSSAGLPIVARRTAELAHHEGLLYLADDAEDFVAQLRHALDESEAVNRKMRDQHTDGVLDRGIRMNGRSQERRLFAERNTWEDRVRDFLCHLRQGERAA